MPRDGRQDAARSRCGAPADQRQESRFRVEEQEGLRGVLDTSCRYAEARVANLSLGGAGLLVKDSDWRSVALCGHLSLWAPGRLLGEVPVDIVHREPFAAGGAGHLLGVRYLSLGQEFLAELCHYLVPRHSQSAARPHFLEDLGQFSIRTDPLRVRRLLLQCARRQRALRVFRINGGPIGSFLPVNLSGERVTGPLELLEGHHVEPGDPLTCLHSSSAGLTLLQTTLFGIQKDQAHLGVPAQLLEGGARRLGRLVARVDFPIHLEFLHPQLPGLLIRKLLREIGFGGMRFDLDIGDLLVPGTLIESATLRLPGGRSLPCRCIIRHISQLLDGSYQCGVQILSFDRAGRDVWVEQILAQMNPEVEQATPLTLHEAWDVFDRSGYLDEKPAEQLLPMRAPFLKTWQKLLRSRGSARCWLHRSHHHRAVGTICTSLIYSNTWLVHHMSVDRALPAGRKLLVLADLGPGSVLQWLAGSHPSANVLIYYDASASFNRTPYTTFFEPLTSTGDVSLQSVRLREYSVSAFATPTPTPGAASDVWVRRPRRRELRRISAELLARDGRLRYHAFDFSPASLRRGSHDGPGERGMRRREVLLAGEKAVALGFALVEFGPPGINIFSLYDTTRLVIWDEDTGRRPRLMRALVGHAAACYQKHGRCSFLLLSAPDETSCPEQPIFEAAAMQAVIAPGLVPHWFQHLVRLWGQH